jgi:1,4-dihydroxy-2-naphthoate octaprenyltransferase
LYAFTGGVFADSSLRLCCSFPGNMRSAILLAMFMLIPAFCTSFLLFPWKDFYFSSLIFCLLVLVNVNLKISQKHHQTQMMQMMQIMMPQHVINDAISISSPLSTNIC